MKQRWLMGSGVVLIMILSGCMGISQPTVVQQTDARSPLYQAGYNDGCTTAHGEYKKDSKLFRTDRDYYDGWFAGRSTCQNS